MIILLPLCLDRRWVSRRCSSTSCRATPANASHQQRGKCCSPRWPSIPPVTTPATPRGPMHGHSGWPDSPPSPPNAQASAKDTPTPPGEDHQGGKEEEEEEEEALIPPAVPCPSSGLGSRVRGEHPVQ
jgi:hypothetical protein